MERIGAIKLLQPDIEIWVAVGGWTFNDPEQPTRKTFGDIAASESNQDKFINSVLKIMNTFGFDGIDIDWYVQIQYYVPSPNTIKGISGS
jgi:chitinase